MIAPMLHLDMVFLASDREMVLRSLSRMGAVQLTGVVVDTPAANAERLGLAQVEKAIRLVTKARETIGEEVDERPRTVAEVLAIEEDRIHLNAAVDELRRQIRIYEPYGDFDPALVLKLRQAGVELEKVATLPAVLPTMRLGRMKEKLQRLEHRIAIDTAKLAGTDFTGIEAAFPDLQDRLNFALARAALANRGELQALSGWVPAARAEEVRKVARELGGATVLRPARDAETPPTLIVPPKFVRPVKALFEGLGIAPAYGEADVSVPFMCYFSLFFAMLVGDGAYGVIFLVATLFGWHKFGKISQAMTPKAIATRSWFILMTVFSIATIVWGALSNTWFGAGIAWCASWPTVRWLSGAGAAAGHEYDNMMFLCFTIGVSHLMLARIWNGLCKLNDRSCLSEFGWAGIVLFMYILTNSIVGIFSGIPIWAYWMMGVAFLTVFIQAKGMDKGMLFLNAMSVLGDIISYVRLFAVGLASVKVAENFNAMALDLGLPIWLKWLPLVLILVIGHGLNLAMAGLSVLVHAVRLNTLEFSNHKGISWAGYAFKPFQKIKE